MLQSSWMSNDDGTGTQTHPQHDDDANAADKGSGSMIPLKCNSCGGIQYLPRTHELLLVESGTAAPDNSSNDVASPNTVVTAMYGPTRCTQCSRIAFLQHAVPSAAPLRDTKRANYDGIQHAAPVDEQQRGNWWVPRPTPSPPSGPFQHNNPHWQSQQRQATSSVAAHHFTPRRQSHHNDASPFSSPASKPFWWSGDKNTAHLSSDTPLNVSNGPRWSPNALQNGGGGVGLRDHLSGTTTLLQGRSSGFAASPHRLPSSVTTAVASSPSIVFRRPIVAAAAGTLEVSTAHHLGYYDEGSSARRVAEMLQRPSVRKTTVTLLAEAATRTSGESSLRSALELLRKNRERLAYRYFQAWIIWSTRRQRRSVYASSSPTSAAALSSHRAPYVNDGNDSSLLASDGMVRDLVASLIAAQDAHAAHVKDILLSIGGSMRSASRSPSLPRDASTATAFVAPRSHATAHPVTDDVSTTTPRRARAASLTSTRGGSTGERPLSALVRAQAAQALVVLPRQEDVARRETAREELDLREELELHFHSSRRLITTQESGYSPRQILSRMDNDAVRTAHYGSTVSELVQRSDQQERISRNDATEAIAATAQRTIAKRELELELARVVGRETSARRLLLASESNAAVSFFADLQQQYDLLAMRDAEGRRNRQSTSEALSRRLSSMSLTRANEEEPRRSSGSARPVTSSLGLTATDAAAASSSPTFRNRAVSFTGNADGTAQVPTLSSSSGHDDVRVQRASAGGGSSATPSLTRARSFTSATSNDAGARTTTTPQSTQSLSDSTSSASPRRRAQSLVPNVQLDADSGVGVVIAAELKGRKSVIKAYKLGLEGIIEYFAGQAAALSSH